MKNIAIEERILKSNTEFADKNKELLRKKGVMAINIFGSPGAGKTSILERVIDYMKDYLYIGVIEGDLYTSRDGMRIDDKGAEVVQINTCGACHLDAAMIARAYETMNMDKLQLIFIENVGNLVCPASFDLGESKRITVLSITEGNDKPLKYPFIFKQADIVILNKLDLIDYTDFDLEEFYQDIFSINQDIKLFLVSARNGEGIKSFCDYLSDLVKN